MAVNIEHQLVAALFSQFADRIGVDPDGYVTMAGTEWEPISISSILRSLKPDAQPTSAQDAHEQLLALIRGMSPEQYQGAGFVIPPPLKGYHYAPVEGLYYDFVNTDRVLTELVRSGAELRGNILDFGCSTGRSAAQIHRAQIPGLTVFGCDPVPSSINWAQENVRGVEWALSKQDPPLPYPDGLFDLGFARSIWTHFSLRAGRAWLDEIARILKPSGHFFFNFHSAHDLANRLIFNTPNPHYPGIANGEFPDKVSFLAAMIKGLREDGFMFRPYSSAESQSDLGKIEDARIEDWGVAFMTLEFIEEHLIPPDLEIVRYTPAATAGRLDGIVLRKK